MFFFFFFNDTATTEIYTLSLHDALPITSMKRLRHRQEHVQKEVRKAMDYFQTNKERMRYAQFRSQGLFVGSGVVEAGCKTIIGQRLKQSGMRWTVNHANAIIALRCSQLSGRWEEFWEQRAAG